MKIAVLFKGLPRKLEPVSQWWKHKFIDRYPRINFDFYCHFWNDNEIDLDKKIVDAFNPVNYSTDSYNNIFTDFMYRLLNMCKENNHRPSLFDLVKKDISIDDNIDDILEILKSDKFLYNLLGQYISSEKVFDIIDSEKIKEYDLIILTRSDLVLRDEDDFYNTMNIIINQIKNEDVTHDTIYPHGMREIPDNDEHLFISDLILIGSYISMSKYLSNFKEKLFKIFYDDKTNYGFYLQHNIWYILGKKYDIKWAILKGEHEILLLDSYILRMDIAPDDIIKMTFEDLKIKIIKFNYYDSVRSEIGHNMSEEEITQYPDTFVSIDDYVNGWIEKNRIPSVLKKNGEMWFYP